jgi:hypothetical protein
MLSEAKCCEDVWEWHQMGGDWPASFRVHFTAAQKTPVTNGQEPGWDSELT